MKNEYYVYVHINKLTKDIFYVGKGKLRRAWAKTKRNKLWKNYIKENEYEIVILQDNMLENEALNLEMFLIKKLGRDNLVNLTDGGEKGYGYIMSDEQKNRYRELFKGEKNPFYGKTHNEETRKKLSRINIGRLKSEKAKQIASEICKNRIGDKHPMYGKKHKEDSIIKMRESNKGSNNPMYGKNHSEETKKIMSDLKKGDKHPFYGKKRPHHSSLMSNNNPSSKKIEFEGVIYNSIINLWRDKFSDINERAFRQRINRGKIKINII